MTTPDHLHPAPTVLLFDGHKNPPVEALLADAWVTEVRVMERSGRGRFELARSCGYTDSVWRAGLHTETYARAVESLFPEKYAARPFVDVLREDLTAWGEPAKYQTAERLRLAMALLDGLGPAAREASNV